MGDFIKFIKSEKVKRFFVVLWAYIKNVEPSEPIKPHSTINDNIISTIMHTRGGFKYIVTYYNGYQIKEIKILNVTNYNARKRT